MLSVQQAMQSLKKQYPKRQVTQAIDYDRNWFLFLAVEDPKKIDYDAPYYAVSKKNGRVCAFNPVDELEKFTDALYERQIEI